MKTYCHITYFICLRSSDFKVYPGN